MRAAVAFLLILVSGPACAQAIPLVGVDAVCRNAVAQNGFVTYRGRDLSERYDRCLAENQKYYDELKANWGKLSWAEKHDCLDQKPTSPDTRYQFLSSCMGEKIREEQSRRRAQERAEEIQAIPKKEFRY